VKITLGEPGENGLRELAIGDQANPGEEGWFTWLATQHDLNDLEAVLATDKAKARTCPATDGDHTCGLIPPPHYANAHVCRACPHTWTSP
jgi:hypothetical protein